MTSPKRLAVAMPRRVLTMGLHLSINPEARVTFCFVSHLHQFDGRLAPSGEGFLYQERNALLDGHLGNLQVLTGWRQMLTASTSFRRSVGDS